jgi:hypothetical protein
MRVLVLVLSSRGGAYDGMRRAWSRARAPPCVDVRFLYGGGGDVTYGDGDGAGTCGADVTYNDIPETIVPGALDKTLRFLSGTCLDGYDYVVRTNLSSWFHWARLLAWLADQPRTGFAAGYSPDGTHLSGCNLTLSRDLAQKLATAPLDRGLVDDLAWSPWLRANATHVESVPRLDLVYDASVLFHGDAAAGWHVRLKHTDRDIDVAVMDALVHAYDPAADLVSQVRLAIYFAGLGYHGSGLLRGNDAGRV